MPVFCFESENLGLDELQKDWVNLNRQEES